MNKDSKQGFRTRLTKALTYTVIGGTVGFVLGFVASTPITGEVIKLTTHERILPPIERVADGYGSVLVEIQDQVYAVEDTRHWRLRRMKVEEGSTVQVVFSLDEDDRVSKIHIVGTI